MSLKTDLETKARETFSSQWKKRDGNVIPTDTSVGLGNDGIEIDATVLYADLSKSTTLVDSYSADFAAEIYKTYLHTASKIIKAEGGEITAFDGDRVMAVFIGVYKNSSAVKAALKINYAVIKIINPSVANTYGADVYAVRQVCGVDTSKLLVAKTGIRGANDLVWVGRAANYAAKLCSEDAYPTFITEAVYKKLSDETKFSNGVDMWDARSWTTMNNFAIYGSNYVWNL